MWVAGQGAMRVALGCSPWAMGWTRALAMCMFLCKVVMSFQELPLSLRRGHLFPSASHRGEAVPVVSSVY